MKTKSITRVCIHGILFVAFGTMSWSQTLHIPSGTSGIGMSSNANVGIGSSTPEQRLTIADVAPTALLVRGNTGGSTPYTASLVVTESNIDYRGRGLFLPTTSGEAGASWFAGVPYSGGGFQIGNSDVHAFYNGGGPYTKPQSRLFISNNGNVGIGTTAPDARLSIGSFDGEHLRVHHGSGVYAAQLTGYNGGEYLIMRNSDSWSERVRIASSGNSYFMGGNVGIGTANPSHKLAVNGTIKAKEVIVETTGWSDYVFADDYRLAPLSEVEAHIKAERRLPGIPSEQEVAEQGVSVGEMQAALLAKIEELTLHQIEQEKRIAALESENATLRCGR